MKKKIVVGKVDYENKGTASNSVEIEYSLKDGRFSASGNIWMSSRKDILSGGQNLEEIADMFPDHDLVQRIVKVWKKWHLNDMKAGSPKQEEFLANLNLPNNGNFHETAKAKLKDAGLDPDESFLHYNKPYEYGSAWITIDLPDAVVAEIESWPGVDC